MAGVAVCAATGLTCGTAFGSSSSSASPAFSAAAAGLRPLSLRRVGRGGSGVSQTRRRGRVGYEGPSALFERGGGGSGNESKKDKKKFITKEQEPEQYWMAADEKEGKNPMTTPLPYIVILGVLSPFVILAVAFANNWIKVPVR